MNKEYEPISNAEEQKLRNGEPSLAEVEKIQRDVLTYCKILEGFLAHPWWEFVVPRYNLGINESNEALLRNMIYNFA